MRQLFVVLISLLYLLLSSGFTQFSHECKGAAVRLVSLTSSAAVGDQPCPICLGKEKNLKKSKKDCCKHASKTLKVDVSTSGSGHTDFAFKIFAHVFPERMLGALFDRNVEGDFLFNAHYYSTKLVPWSNPLYIFYCVYRI
ncbi:hypothetical protein [Sphingobacterium faecale]|uniref:Uncharacterized protein n=1 Tax=Sphingobacterium faecale TaxID=2803775 RepID=A0ABS1R5J8_9SPHI|nr:hypothetical protein [Sphingobacterium faecale]MBL1409986.1 hypothetical protein [Sphingobacterium faecale]